MANPLNSSALIIEPADPVGEIARQLIQDLCAEMSGRYGTAPSPFSSSEAAAERTVFLVARLDGQPVGCGALRRIDDDTAEIKRMYVAPPEDARASRASSSLSWSATPLGSATGRFVWRPGFGSRKPSFSMRHWVTSASQRLDLTPVIPPAFALRRNWRMAAA